MPAYSTTRVPCNNICLQSGRVVKPLVIEDVPSSAPEERMNQQYLSNATITIIEEPPYLEILTPQKAVEQLQFNLLGELKNLYVKNPLL